MNFIKLSLEPTTATEFISDWSEFYREGNEEYSEDRYEKHLNRNGCLTPENVQSLFRWKNNNTLSAKKQILVDKIKAEIPKLNDFRNLPKVTETDFDKFWSFTFSIIHSGIVYRVYLVHISRPDEYPLVDQHVLRAWNFLTTRLVENPEQTLETYLKYKAFIMKLSKQTNKSWREIDKALMPFGQFLNSQFGKSVKS